MRNFIITDNRSTRDGFGDGLVEAGRMNPNIVALAADLTESVKMTAFMKEFPDRFFQAGVAEANMICVAAGMTIGGKIPFTGTFANFSTSRVYDQIRQSVAYSNKNVKICASHSGLTVGEDGATHQVLEDIGMMKMLPNMTVINSCNYNQTKQATLAIAKHVGPVYFRFGRPNIANFDIDEFVIGKGIILNKGKDVTIIATGHLVWKAIQAGIQLAEKGIDAEIINIHTIKPLDKELVLRSVLKTKCVVTAEEHQRNGGLGDSIAQLVVRNIPVPIEMVAVNDEFGQSGKPDELLAKYHLDTPDIIDAVLKVIARKIT